MSSTIFCTFDQQDLADLAIGRLRSEFPGIYSAGYTSEFRGVHHDDDREHPTQWTSLFGQGPNVLSTGVTPSRPASIQIMCDSSISKQVAARLVNLHGYRIVEA